MLEKFCGILIGITLNLLIIVQKISIFITLGLPTHEYSRFFHLIPINKLYLFFTKPFAFLLNLYLNTFYIFSRYHEWDIFKITFPNYLLFIFRNTVLKYAFWFYIQKKSLNFSVGFKVCQFAEIFCANNHIVYNNNFFFFKKNLIYSFLSYYYGQDFSYITEQKQCQSANILFLT